MNFRIELDYLYGSHTYIRSTHSSVNNEKSDVRSDICFNSSFYNSRGRNDRPELCIFVQVVSHRGKETVHKLTVMPDDYLGNHQSEVSDRSSTHSTLQNKFNH
jgi:hypothetical protein